MCGCCSTQGYEVTEEEVQIPLDEFRTKYSDHLGYPEYAILFQCFVLLFSTGCLMQFCLQSQQDENQRSSYGSNASQVHTATQQIKP